jgi:hypothetical protein
MRVSRATLCPLGQPNKAIGHEPLIGPWLATLRPPGLSVSGAESDRHDCRITPREEANLLASHREANRNCTSNQGGWMPAKTVSGSRLREECFFLDIPFNRTFRDFSGRIHLGFKVPPGDNFQRVLIRLFIWVRLSLRNDEASGVVNHGRQLVNPTLPVAGRGSHVPLHLLPLSFL